MQITRWSTAQYNIKATLRLPVCADDNQGIILKIYIADKTTGEKYYKKMLSPNIKRLCPLFEDNSSLIRYMFQDDFQQPIVEQNSDVVIMTLKFSRNTESYIVKIPIEICQQEIGLVSKMTALNIGIHHLEEKIKRLEEENAQLEEGNMQLEEENTRLERNFEESTKQLIEARKGHHVDRSEFTLNVSNNISEYNADILVYMTHHFPEFGERVKKHVSSYNFDSAENGGNCLTEIGEMLTTPNVLVFLMYFSERYNAVCIDYMYMPYTKSVHLVFRKTGRTVSHYKNLKDQEFNRMLMPGMWHSVEEDVIRGTYIQAVYV